MRSKTNHNEDKHIFTNTAKSMKKINIGPRISRGGIRF